MAKPQLSARIAKTKDTTHPLALGESRSIAEVVEPAQSFYARISSYSATTDARDGDAELYAIINEARKPHSGIDL